MSTDMRTETVEKTESTTATLDPEVGRESLSDNIEEAREELESKVEDAGKRLREGVNELIESARERGDRTVESIRGFGPVRVVRTQLRRAMLASLGAAALVKDQVVEVTDRCVERGEQVELEGRDYARRAYDDFITIAQKARTRVTESMRLSDSAEVNESTPLDEVVRDEDAVVTGETVKNTEKAEQVADESITAPTAE